MLSVLRVMRSGQLAQGPQVAAFEHEFSMQVVEGIDSIAVNSGTSALHLILLGLTLKPGDEVIVPSFTFAATANAVRLTGATPVFVDVEDDTFCISPDAIKRKITPRTRAVIAVHIFGHPANLPRISEICEQHNIYLIEDAAQAHMASIFGQKVGTWGIASAFSFYPTKNMTTGEGGMITTKDPELARQVRLLRNQGQEIRYQNEVVGLNNRMTEICAAIGREQLRKLPQWTYRRQENAAFYSANLKGVQTPSVRDGANHVFHQYTIRINDRDRSMFVSKLADHGVATGIYYPIPVHKLTPYVGNHENMSITESLVDNVLSIPVHPHLGKRELRKVASAIAAVAEMN